MGEPALDLSEIIDLYKEDVKRMVGLMRSAMGRWDELVKGGAPHQELRRLSHQLRGSGRTYGFHNVTRISKALEHIVQKLEKKTLAGDERVKQSLAKKIERLDQLF